MCKIKFIYKNTQYIIVFDIKKVKFVPDNLENNNTSSEINDVPQGIFILTRNTYDNWVEDNKIDPTSAYFVIENVTDADKYLSLYVGTSRQTDIVNLNTITGFTDAASISSIQQFIQESSAPIKNLLTTNKIYYWEDTDLHVMRAYMLGEITKELIPLYNEPIWEKL